MSEPSGVEFDTSKGRHVTVGELVAALSQMPADARVDLHTDGGYGDSLIVAVSLKDGRVDIVGEQDFGYVPRLDD